MEPTAAANNKNNHNNKATERLKRNFFDVDMERRARQSAEEIKRTGDNIQCVYGRKVLRDTCVSDLASRAIASSLHTAHRLVVVVVVVVHLTWETQIVLTF